MAPISPVGPSNIHFGERPYSPPQPTPESPYGNYMKINQQSYLPTGDRIEDIDSKLQKQVDKGMHSLWPRIGAGFSTPLTEMLASPSASAVFGSIGAAFLFAAGGFVMFERKVGALLGGVVGAAIGGFSGFAGRRRQNDNILDVIHRMPKGSTPTKRDYDADPARQAELNRAAMRSSGSSGGDILTTMAVASMFNGGGFRSTGRR